MKFILVLLALNLVACASTTPLKEETASRQLHFKSVSKEEITKYSDPVHGLPESQVKSQNCTKYYGKVKAQWDWKEAVSAGTACFKNKEMTKVEEIGDLLSQRESQSPWGPYFLAMTAKERGEFERATWLVELALSRAPDLGILHFLKGQVLWNKKEYTLAIQEFEAAVMHENSLLPAHFILGQVYFRDQEYSKASSHFHIFLKSEPRNKIALYGFAESELAEKNPQAAVDSYKRLSEEDPGDGFYLMRLAELYEQSLHNSTEALSLYKKLRQNIKSGQIVKNIDPDIDSKIKQLEVTVNRSVAGSKEK